MPNISSKTKKYNIIQLSDLFKKNKYNGECFCYLVMTGNNVKEFYNYWCWTKGEIVLIKVINNYSGYLIIISINYFSIIQLTFLIFSDLKIR